MSVLLLLGVLLLLELGARRASAQVGTFTPLGTFTPIQSFTPIETFTPIRTFTPIKTFTPIVTSTLPGSTPTPTRPRTPSPTGTVMASATATGRTASPTRTRTRTPPAFPTDTPLVLACVGDCNLDGAININELIVAVAIALDISPLDSCADIDDNSDLLVTIDEIIDAVNGALTGCQ